MNGFDFINIDKRYPLLNWIKYADIIFLTKTQNSMGYMGF